METRTRTNRWSLECHKSGNFFFFFLVQSIYLHRKPIIFIRMYYILENSTSIRKWWKLAKTKFSNISFYWILWNGSYLGQSEIQSCEQQNCEIIESVSVHVTLYCSTRWLVWVNCAMSKSLAVSNKTSLQMCWKRRWMEFCFNEISTLLFAECWTYLAFRISLETIFGWKVSAICSAYITYIYIYMQVPPCKLCEM